MSYIEIIPIHIVIWIVTRIISGSGINLIRRGIIISGCVFDDVLIRIRSVICWELNVHLIILKVDLDLPSNIDHGSRINIEALCWIIS